MKKLLIFLLSTVLFVKAHATTYYFDTSGNDLNTGTTTTSPYKTISKFNTIFGTRAIGDQFLFKRGQTFYGELQPSRSGGAGTPMFIGAYGTGANPIITGLTSITSWTNSTTGNVNIWESTNPVTSLTVCNFVLIGGVNTPMGRYPNTGYLIYDSAHTNTLYTKLLNSPTNWTGADLIVRTIPWMLERNPITAHSASGVITYTGGSSTGRNGSGFFIQNDVRTLDAQNEWYFNPSTRKLRIYSTTMPTNVQVPTLDITALLNTVSYITFDNINFTGANVSLVENRNSQHFVIQNCNLHFSGSNGILIDPNVSGGVTMEVNNNTFDDCNRYAINSGSWYSNTWIHNNIVNNTNMILGSGTTSQYDGDALLIRGPGSIVEYNVVNNSGHHGISIISNDNLTARYNYVTNWGMTRYDAGGIYSWNSDTNVINIGRIIDHNIIIGSNPTPTGIGAFDANLHAIYIDGKSNKTTITNNTVSGAYTSGIHIYSSGSITILNNTSYNNGYGNYFGAGNIDLYDATSTPIVNMVIKDNIIFAKTATQHTLTARNSTGVFTNLGVLDSNYYARPVDDNLSVRKVVGASNPTITDITLATWKSLSTKDTHTNKSPITVPDVSYLRLEYNPTQSSVTIPLDATYSDVRGVSYNGTITLAPYTSAVLMRTGAIVVAPTIQYRIRHNNIPH